ncbi:MAG TPA: carboxypeptidase-like regulatory domain-containing protein [Terriglobales bacterium]|nr:carboxypeptidase-like regulatory domain-containing protein [Terriglobales bacterium]
MPDTFSGTCNRFIRGASAKSTLLGYIAAFSVHIAIPAACAFAFSVVAAGQVLSKSDLNPATLVGTVMDINGDTVPNATVSLIDLNGADPSTFETAENGFFQFSHLRPEIPYQIKIAAKGFAEWTSSAITLQPGQFKIIADVRLRIRTEQTAIQVTYDPVEVATEQFKIEETQRLWGVLPNFYVAYDANAEPLTAKRKFALALRVSADPVTVAGVALVSGAKQASNSPDYGQGAEGYGERFGAVAADGFSDIIIGGAILPTLLHQDPRYFYQGTGTTGSRIRHAMLSPFWARYDNGSWGPNFSSLGGDLASSALSNLYYPTSNRGIGLVFGNFAIGTAERVGASLAQEFLFAKFTRRGGHVK